MSKQELMSRRKMVKGSAATLAMAMGGQPLANLAFAELAPGEEAIPFLDAATPRRTMLEWDKLTSWITPSDELFVVSHYNEPEIDAADWKLRIGGLVDKPLELTLDQIRARPSQDFTSLLECGGNGASSAFRGAIANLSWTGTPLAPVLAEAGVDPEAVEIVFYGADQGEEELRGAKYMQHFSRSLPVGFADANDVMLVHGMDGEPLSAEHGFPLRLAVPGWFGVAWVKWLSRIEAVGRRHVSRFMSRDYVTIRGEKRGGETIWRESLVGPINLKSMVARAVKRTDGSVRLTGAAWSDGTKIDRVEVSIDGGDWRRAEWGEGADAAATTWKFWSIDWTDPGAGEHTIVSRAIDANGNIQPVPSDPWITEKKTYWEANQQIERKINI